MKMRETYRRSGKRSDIVFVATFMLVATLTIQKAAHAQKIVIEQEDPCQSKSRVVADITYCDRYWECTGKGERELFDCPNGLIWVGKGKGIADGCDYPWRYPNMCANKDLANPPISTEHCDWMYGIFGHETSCTRFWTCWNGTATGQSCVGGLLYDEETHACNWPQFVAGCEKHPLCEDNPNGNVRLGKSCNRYWACQGGYPRLQRCPAMLVFSPERKRCVPPPTENCDIPPPPPVVFKNNNDGGGNEGVKTVEQQQRQQQRNDEGSHAGPHPSRQPHSNERSSSSLNSRPPNINNNIEFNDQSFRGSDAVQGQQDPRFDNPSG